MSNFSTGFVTGLANSLAGGIEERSKTARDYFQKQYEIATTVGIENHRKVQTAVDGSVRVARQLQQMGVPKDIIMAVASQDPTNLGDFYEDVTKAQANGVVLNQDFFDDFVTVSDGFKAPDEDFYTFFKKALSPIQDTAAANPEGFNRDRKGGLFSAFMAVDPYGSARRQLDDTVVIDGLSATDLARYGENYSPAGVEGAPTVTYDYSKTDTSEAGELSVSEIGSVEKTVEDFTTRNYTSNNSQGKTMSWEEARRLAIEEARRKYRDVPGVDEYLRRTLEDLATPAPLVPPPGAEELKEAGIGDAPSKEPLTEAPSSEAIPAPVEETSVSGDAPRGSSNYSRDPIDPTQENLGNIMFKGTPLTFYKNNDDGSVMYTDPEGNTFSWWPEEVREFQAVTNSRVKKD